MDEKKYRLRYQGQWMKTKHMLGTYVYDLCDNMDDVELMSYKKAIAWKNLISEDCHIERQDIEMVEFQEGE